MAIKDILLKLQPALLAFLTLAVLVSLAMSDKAFVSPWLPGPLMALTVWTALTLTLAVALKFISPHQSPWILTSLIVIFLMIGVGAIPSLVTLLFCGSIGVTGQLILNMVFRDRVTSWWESLVCGATFYVGMIGGLLHFPINYRSTYVLLLLTPLFINLSSTQRRQQFITQLSTGLTHIKTTLVEIPYWVLTAALVVGGFIATFAFLPSVMHDDYTYHLAMWTQLEFKHQYHFDASIQRWSVAPFTLDSLHGFLSLIAGADARGALNLHLYCLFIAVFWYLAGLITTKSTDRLLALILLLSTPMVANLLQGLQTELLLSMLTLTGVTFLVKRDLAFANRSLSLFFICSLLCATKFPATFIAVAFAVIWCICYREDIKRQFESRRINIGLILSLVISSLIALHPYINAYWRTGNPIYPLFNHFFNPGSPIHLAPIFVGKPDLATYAGFFFDSGKYFESSNFIAGFQYFLLPLAGALYCAMFCTRLFTLALCLPIALYGSVIFFEMQYWRYFFPLLPLASLLILIFLVNAKTGKATSILNKATLVIYLLINLFYLPGVSWLFHSNHLWMIDAATKANFEYQHSPEYRINSYVNEAFPNATVLMAVGRPFGATLSGTPIYPATTAPDTLDRMRNIKDVQTLESFLASKHINIVYWNESNDPPRFAFEPLLKNLLDQYGTKEKTFGSISVYQLKLPCTMEQPPCKD